MKPVTPEQYAKCYGTFIADINKTDLPALTAWFNSSFNELTTMVKLNQAVFSSYPASVSALPKKPHMISVVSMQPATMTSSGITSSSASDDPKGTAAYNKAIDNQWASLTIGLKNSTSAAEMDASKANRLVASLEKIKPTPIKVGKF
jgi:hypothetical protein